MSDKTHVTREHLQVVVMVCPRCGARLTEHFDQGYMSCDRCDADWPLPTIIGQLAQVVATLLGELERGGSRAIQPGLALSASH